MKNKDFDYILLFFSIVVILSSCTLAYYMKIIQVGDLSNSQSVAFSLALSAATTALSIIVSILIGRKALENELETYGKLATRRIIQSIKSCKSILEILCVRKALVQKENFLSKEVADEFMSNIVTQVTRLMSTIFDSREDWRDILKDESKEAAELDEQFSETLVKYAQSERDLGEAKQLLEQTKGDRGKVEEKIKHLEKELKKSQDELLQKKKQLEQTNNTWPSGLTMTGTSGTTVTTGLDWFDMISSNAKNCKKCGKKYASDYILGDTGHCNACRAVFTMAE